MSDSKEAFAKNLAYYVEISGNKQRDIAAEIGVSAPTMSDWVNGKKFPRIDKIEMLAAYFGIQKSDLIEEREKDDAVEQKKLVQKKWDAQFGDILFTEEELDELMNYASFLLSKRNM